MRAAVPTAPLHGEGHPRDGGRRGVPEALPGGTGPADKNAERIVQLGGAPDFDPAGLSTRSHSEYFAADELVEMIRENLVAERVAIESYSEIIRYIREGDPTSRRLMVEILAVEEEHADDMKTLLEALGPQGKSEKAQ
jgi:bacterioferritin